MNYRAKTSVPALLIVVALAVCCPVSAQTITGVVKNSQGTAIANALITVAADPSKFAKSAANGSYSLEGGGATTLVAAAMGYASKRNVNVGSGQVDITLEKDPVLDSCVFHLNFDALRPGKNYTADELKADLHVAHGAGFADDRVNPTDATNRASIDPNESVDGVGSSLKVRFPKGELKSSGSGVDTRIPIQGTYKDNPFKAKELFLSYWVKFSDNFQFDKCGGKLPSLGGDYPADESRWKGRIMWRVGGSIQFYPETINADQSFAEDAERFWGEKLVHKPSLCERTFTPYLTTGKWHNIELYYKFETPGNKDGIFEGWVDGGKGHRRTNSENFGFWLPQGSSKEMTINNLLVSAFLGGSSTEYEPTEDIHAWFDDFKISDKRINEYHRVSGQDPSAVSQQRGLRLTPQRVEGVIHLEVPGNWRVYSVSGKPILEGRGSVIDLSSQAKGLYLLKSSGQSQLVVR